MLGVAAGVCTSGYNSLLGHNKDSNGKHPSGKWTSGCDHRHWAGDDVGLVSSWWTEWCSRFLVFTMEGGRIQLASSTMVATAARWQTAEKRINAHWDSLSSRRARSWNSTKPYQCMEQQRVWAAFQSWSTCSCTPSTSIFQPRWRVAKAQQTARSGKHHTVDSQLGWHRSIFWNLQGGSHGTSSWHRKSEWALLQFDLLPRHWLVSGWWRSPSPFWRSQKWPEGRHFADMAGPRRTSQFWKQMQDGPTP